MKEKVCITNSMDNEQEDGPSKAQKLQDHH